MNYDIVISGLGIPRKHGVFIGKLKKRKHCDAFLDSAQLMIGKRKRRRRIRKPLLKHVRVAETSGAGAPTISTCYPNFGFNVAVIEVLGTLDRNAGLRDVSNASGELHVGIQTA